MAGKRSGKASGAKCKLSFTVLIGLESSRLLVSRQSRPRGARGGAKGTLK